MTFVGGNLHRQPGIPVILGSACGGGLAPLSLGVSAMTEPELTKNKVDTSTELRARITHALHSRHAPRGTRLAKLEDELKRHGMTVWRLMERRPLAASVAVGGAGLAVAMSVGVGEVTLAMLVGYAAYQVLREGVPPKEAAHQMFAELEHAG